MQIDRKMENRIGFRTQLADPSQCPSVGSQSRCESRMKDVNGNFSVSRRSMNVAMRIGIRGGTALDLLRN